jgi:acetyl-CoA acetyltransferase
MCQGELVAEPVFIVAAVRTPFGLRDGALSGWHPVDLAAVTLRALVDGCQLDPARIDDVVLGCVSPVGAQARNLGRNAVLAAGWPEGVPGTVVDRQGASGAQAVLAGVDAVQSGRCQLVVAGGVECTSSVPLGAPLMVLGAGRPFGPLIHARYGAKELIPSGPALERLAESLGFEREQLDEWSERSRTRAEAAGAPDWLVALARRSAPAAEVPGPAERRTAAPQTLSPAPARAASKAPSKAASKGPAKAASPAPVHAAAAKATAVAQLKADEALSGGRRRPALSSYKPLFEPGGRLTAGNTAAEGDGAVVILLASEAMVAEHGWEPLCRVTSAAAGATSPTSWPLAGSEAAKVALGRRRLGAAALDRLEIHESSALGVLAITADLSFDPERVNPGGGALARTSPEGAAGAEVVASLAHGLASAGRGRGMAIVAAEGGLGLGLILER